MLDHDFTEKYYEIRYFGYMDILSIIGGLNASIGPIFGLFTPLFILNFLYQLAQLIINKNKKNYHQELIKLHADYRDLFSRIDVNNPKF